MTTLDHIIERNQRVEADKAWETSFTRRFCIAALTYLVAALYMYSIGVPNVLLNALIPTGGFLLSTLSLGVMKNFWLHRFYRRSVSS